MKVTTRPAWILTVLLAAMLAVSIAGCGDDEGPTKTYGEAPVGQAQKVTVPPDEEFDADQQAVIETIANFADATQAKDWATLCNELLTEESAKIGNGDCEQVFKAASKEFESFEIEIKSVAVGEDGKTATVDTVTTTDGKPADRQYNLTKNDQGQWRIAILGQ